MNDEPATPDENEPIPMAITGELDLHTFRPSDIGDLIPDYLEECRRKGILEVKLAHGKGSGVLKKGVHALLRKTPGVVSFSDASAYYGGWGATIVKLEPLE